jgi:DNA-binding MarR family transcriptional regulator
MDAMFDLEDFLPYRLNRAAEVASAGFAALYRERHHMTRAEWRVLALLGCSGRLAAAQIVRRSGMHKTKVSRAVAALERRNWLLRSTDAEDRRVERLELTEGGRAALQELASLAREHDALLRSRLGVAGLAALEEALVKLTSVASPTGLSESAGLPEGEGSAVGQSRINQLDILQLQKIRLK